MSARHRLHVASADADRARRALAVLRAAEATEIEVRGSIPLPDDLDPEPPAARGRSKVLPAALAGALAGGLGAWLIASQTALSYPIFTGGMPLVAGPPVAIVTYEGTALGLILATVAAVVLEGRLWRRARVPEPLDGLLADGWILTHASVPETALERAVRALEAIGGPEAVRTAVDDAPAAAAG
ncbi:MAG TPA: quinol:electron acceptor oxidoreductase subunit ActD [Thermoanaerobaculia bacterium]|nr:quinol:electron acceptor oxidoreductase subunit ActD [Thermoanaerobaculia bacterium]